MFGKRVISLGLTVLSTLLIATAAQGAEAPEAPAPMPKVNYPNGDFCGTERIFEQRFPNRYKAELQACQLEGPCDDPTTRDLNIPGPPTNPLIFRLKFNVFREDDGTNAATTVARIGWQMDELRADYAPYGIDFVYTYEFIDDSQYRILDFSEEVGMKTTYADQPDKQCNVYVVNAPVNWGTFPWDPNDTQAMGGIVMHEGSFGFQQSTLTHELGHCFGLWHTHHGVDEVSQCSACYELADKSNGDIAGDFCSDTDPTPTSTGCHPPGGDDPCSATPWGPTDIQNFMGYSGDACWTEFSTQQSGRIYCWVTQELLGWVQFNFSADQDTAKNVLPATFSYDTPLNATGLTWVFGDGDSAMTAAPTHVYSPGLYDVTLRATFPSGTFERTQQNFITVWADTFTVAPLNMFPSASGVVDIYGVNAVPLKEFVLPITMTNVLSKFLLDSVSFVGTRADYFESKSVVFDNRFAGQLAYRVIADNGGGAPPLPPGSGLMARVYIRSKANAVPGDTTFVSTGTLSSWSLNSTSLAASFTPEFKPATVRVVTACDCPYQADFDANGFRDATDLNSMIDILFFSGTDSQDPACPATRADFNNDGVPDALDLNDLIDHLFFSGPGPCDPCDPVQTSCTP